MIGDKNVLFGAVVRSFVQVAVTDADQEKPGIAPDTAHAIDKIAPFDFA
jgi:hypothetical protein